MAINGQSFEKATIVGLWSQVVPWHFWPNATSSRLDWGLGSLGFFWVVFTTDDHISLTARSLQPPFWSSVLASCPAAWAAMPRVKADEIYIRVMGCFELCYVMLWVVLVFNNKLWFGNIWDHNYCWTNNIYLFYGLVISCEEFSCLGLHPSSLSLTLSLLDQAIAI